MPYNCARGWRLCVFISSVQWQCTNQHCSDFNIYGLYSQARSYVNTLSNYAIVWTLSRPSRKYYHARQRERMTTLYVHIFGSVHIVAIYDQARSYIIKLRNWMNSFSATLYVHIFGSVHAMPMKTYCIIPPFDSVKQYQLIITIVL
jgi:hypothetical protein